MITERTQVGGTFWVRWVLASTVGFAAFGAAVGITQWFVLRRQFSRAGWWVLASAVGFVGAAALLSTVGGAMYRALGDFEGLVLRIAVVGAAVGVAQWFVLRRQVSRAGWWVLASTVGFAVGGALVLISLKDAGLFIGVSSMDYVDWAGLVLSLAVYGAITGGVMVWLLQQPASKERDAQAAA